MSQGPRPAKVQEWSARLGRFAASGQTIKEFCLSEQVSQPTFYHWRRILAEHAAGGLSQSTHRRASFTGRRPDHPASQ